MKDNKVVTISAQIPADLSEVLDNLCKTNERSKSSYIKKALEKFIFELLDQEKAKKKKN
jgi:predicted DNA-binding protein